MDPAVPDSAANSDEVFMFYRTFVLTRPGFGKPGFPVHSLASYQARLVRSAQRHSSLHDGVDVSADLSILQGELKRTFSQFDINNSTDAEQPIPKKPRQERSWHPLFKEDRPKVILVSNDDIHFCVDGDVLSSYRCVHHCLTGLPTNGGLRVYHSGIYA